MTEYTPDPADLGVLSRRARYSRWDGSQRLPDMDADEILDALADDVMAEGDLAEALRRLMERGWRGHDPTRQDMAGLAELRERLRRQRDALQGRFNVTHVLADVRAELEEIVADGRA